MQFDQVNGSFGANSLDGATVVTAQENTQVYELREKRGNARKMVDLYTSKAHAELITTKIQCFHLGWEQAHSSYLIKATPTQNMWTLRYLFIGQADVLQDAIKEELLNWKLPTTQINSLYFMSPCVVTEGILIQSLNTHSH